MFNLFGSKTKKEKLEEKYTKLSNKALELDQTDSKAASKVRREAQMIMQKIVILEKSTSLG
ncbi:Lacal_2735 family protein [Marinoscillum sp. MHG1-6]|uniref:Lacal_2735 family protein n=1 Tax=Marinoscillum sp. MHG1-6 TaxID=2959627 RepID=UPI0021579324|nr:Lacal_2735 family protein [Marinoscillum sp. MHG1-6]